MTTIYLIRHAEAEGNLHRRIQGQYDGFITGRGRRQIAALAERFRDIRVDSLWSSDLYRTRATAGAILKYHPGLTLHTTPRLREIGLGQWEDELWGNVERDTPELLEAFNHAPERWHVEGAESFRELQQRILSIITDIALLNEGKTVVIVCHGTAIRTLHCAVLGVPLSEIGTVAHGDNTAVSLLRYEGGRFRAEYINDVSHLEAEGLSTLARQSWHRNAGSRDRGTLSSRPAEFPQDEAFYTHCYTSCWTAAHGNLTGYMPEVYIRQARRHLQEEAQSIQVFYSETDAVGLLELDPNRHELQGAGWISLCFLEEAFRGKGLGIQLLGSAISFYRHRGRRLLRLHVAVTNEAAIGFYRYCGFREAGRTAGVASELLLMEYRIYPADY